MTSLWGLHPEGVMRGIEYVERYLADIRGEEPVRVEAKQEAAGWGEPSYRTVAGGVTAAVGVGVGLRMLFKSGGAKMLPVERMSDELHSTKDCLPHDTYEQVEEGEGKCWVYKKAPKTAHTPTVPGKWRATPRELHNYACTILQLPGEPDEDGDVHLTEGVGAPCIDILRRALEVDHPSLAQFHGWTHCCTGEPGAHAYYYHSETDRVSWHLDEVFKDTNTRVVGAWGAAQQRIQAKQEERREISEMFNPKPYKEEPSKADTLRLLRLYEARNY